MLPPHRPRLPAVAITLGVLAFAVPFRLVQAASGVPSAITGLAAHSAATPSTPSWNAVSVKPCRNKGGRGGTTIAAPPRLTINCQPVAGLIATAYLIYERGEAHAFYASGTNGTLIDGPSWTRQERYTVNANALGMPSKAVLQGPMMRSIAGSSTGRVSPAATTST
jgi:hypothetical protein